MNWFSHGYHGQRYCSWARTHDSDDDGDDGVAQDNRLTEADGLSLQPGGRQKTPEIFVYASSNEK